MLAQGEGSAHERALHHGGVAAYVDGAGGGVEHAALEARTLLDEHAGAVAYHLHRGAERLRATPGGDGLEVAAQHLAVVHEYVVEAVDGDEGRAGVVAALGGVAAACYQHIVIIQSVALGQGCDGARQLRVGHHVAGHVQRVGGGVAGEELAQIRLRLPGIFAGKECGPLLGDGGDADAEVADGTCIGERQQVVARGMGVEDYDIHRCE